MQVVLVDPARAVERFHCVEQLFAHCGGRADAYEQAVRHPPALGALSAARRADATAKGSRRTSGRLLICGDNRARGLAFLCPLANLTNGDAGRARRSGRSRARAAERRNRFLFKALSNITEAMVCGPLDSAQREVTRRWIQARP